MIRRLSFRFVAIALLLSVSIPGASWAVGTSKSAHLIIVGPGDPMYTYWGHIGISIADADGESLFYDFGNFSFHSENFYRDFAMGRMLYLGMVTRTERFIAYSLTEDRDLFAYPLNLTEDELAILEARMRWWMMPENREYLYDYFRNNCSTIIRDALDEALGGAMAEATVGVSAGRDFRDYARTGSAPSLGAELLLHYLLGPLQDETIDLWEAMFLPQAVADVATSLELPAADGGRRLLAGPPVVLKDSSRAPVPESPRTLWPFTLAAGILTAAAWLLLTALRPGGRFSRGAAAAGRGAIILAVGLPGAFVAFLMAFTDHVSGHANLNLGPALPTILLGLIPAIRAAGREGSEREREERRLARLWAVNLAGLAIVAALRMTGLSAQNAFAFWAFYAPVLLAASRPWNPILRRLRRT